MAFVTASQMDKDTPAPAPSPNRICHLLNNHSESWKEPELVRSGYSSVQTPNPSMIVHLIQHFMAASWRHSSICWLGQALPAALGHPMSCADARASSAPAGTLPPGRSHVARPRFLCENPPSQEGSPARSASESPLSCTSIGPVSLFPSFPRDVWRPVESFARWCFSLPSASSLPPSLSLWLSAGGALFLARGVGPVINPLIHLRKKYSFRSLYFRHLIQNSYSPIFFNLGHS